MKKLYKILIALIIFLPITCYAKTINYDKVKVKLDIDESVWKEEPVTGEEIIIDRKWVNNCGMIMTGVYDIYGDPNVEKYKEFHREDINYQLMFQSDEDAKTIISGLGDSLNVDNWTYKNYKVKFLNVWGSAAQNGMNIDYDIYMTANNGYEFMIQYLKSDQVNTGKCSNTIDQIAASVELITSKVNVDENDESSTFIQLLIALALTIICYEIYPFIMVVIMHKSYTSEEARKMALWNSIVVGVVLGIIALILDGPRAAFNIMPAVTYYWINKHVWANRNTKKKDKKPKKKDKNEEYDAICGNCGAQVRASDIKCPNCGEEFVDNEEKNEDFTAVCSNCGTKVKDSDTKCPNCGEEFETDDDVDLDTDMDKKVSDLKKLKKLLDSKVINKKEFEKEKKKILK